MSDKVNGGLDDVPGTGTVDDGSETAGILDVEPETLGGIYIMNQMYLVA